MPASGMFHGCNIFFGWPGAVSGRTLSAAGPPPSAQWCRGRAESGGIPPVGGGNRRKPGRPAGCHAISCSAGNVAAFAAKHGQACLVVGLHSVGWSVVVLHGPAKLLGPVDRRAVRGLAVEQQDVANPHRYRDPVGGGDIGVRTSILFNRLANKGVVVLTNGESSIDEIAQDVYLSIGSLMGSD